MHEGKNWIITTLYLAHSVIVSLGSYIFKSEKKYLSLLDSIIPSFVCFNFNKISV